MQDLLRSLPYVKDVWEIRKVKGRWYAQVVDIQNNLLIKRIEHDGVALVVTDNVPGSMKGHLWTSPVSSN